MKIKYRASLIVKFNDWDGPATIFADLKSKRLYITCYTNEKEQKYDELNKKIKGMHIVKSKNFSNSELKIDAIEIQNFCKKLSNKNKGDLYE